MSKILDFLPIYLLNPLVPATLLCAYKMLMLCVEDENVMKLYRKCRSCMLKKKINRKF